MVTAPFPRPLTPLPAELGQDLLIRRAKIILGDLRRQDPPEGMVLQQLGRALWIRLLNRVRCTCISG